MLFDIQLLAFPKVNAAKPKNIAFSLLAFSKVIAPKPKKKSVFTFTTLARVFLLCENFFHDFLGVRSSVLGCQYCILQYPTKKVRNKTHQIHLLAFL